MTNLEFNAKVFLMENEDLFFDIYLRTKSKMITKILEDDNLFFRLCAYLQKGNLLDFAYNNNQNIKFVIGTTGFNQQEEEKILLYSNKLTILKSANLSKGINIILKSSLDELNQAILDQSIDIILAPFNDITLIRKDLLVSNTFTSNQNSNKLCFLIPQQNTYFLRVLNSNIQIIN